MSVPVPEQQSLVCPACSTRLRVSATDAPQNGFDCPDCSASLLLSRGDSGELSVSVVDTAAPPVRTTTLSPKLVAAGVTVVAVLLVLVITLSGGPDDPDVVAADSETEANSVVQMPTSPSEQPASVPSPDEPVVQALPEPVVEVAVAEPEIEIQPPAADEPATRIPVDAIDEPEVGHELDTPILPELSPDEPINLQPVLPPFAERIAITIPSFSQSNPTPLSSVIEVIEQLTQVSVKTEAIPAELLSKPVSFALEEATPVEILTEAARHAGLRVEVDEQAKTLELAVGE